MRWILVITFFTIFLGGCFPAQSVWRPAIAGRVIDRRDQIVANAAINVYCDQHLVYLTHTGTDGTFSRPAADKRWFVYFLPQDNPPLPKFTLEVSANGATVVTTPFFGGQIKAFGLGADKLIQFGDIRLP